jgi:hypothetical protein
MLGVDVPDAAACSRTCTGRSDTSLLPTYVIGSIVSAQIWEKAVDAMPALDKRSSGESFCRWRGPGRTPPSWPEVHAKETLQKVTGSDAAGGSMRSPPQFTEIYGLSEWRRSSDLALPSRV